MDDCCDGWHFGLLYDLYVSKGGSCGVDYFGVVCGFDAEYGAEAVGLEV